MAVLTDKPLWRMVVAAMAVASGQKMKAFTALDKARSWLGAD